MDRKMIYAVGAVLLLTVGGLFLLMGGKDASAGEEAPSEEWARLLIEDMDTSPVPAENTVYHASVSDGTLDDDAIIICATPILNLGEEYTPLLIEAEGSSNEPVQRFMELSEMDIVELPTEDPEGTTSGLAMERWEMTEAIVMVSTVNDALRATPLASYLKIPMVFVKDGMDKDTRTMANDLGVRYCISIGDAPKLSTRTMRLPSSQIEEFLLMVHRAGDFQTNYMVVTNPADMYLYDWAEDDKLPIPYLSLLSAQMAGYHNAPVYFTEGLTNLTEERASPENVQLGAPVDVVNAMAMHTKDIIIQARRTIIKSSGTNESLYMAMVGGPVALPFYYHYEASGEGTTTFSDTDYIASDYFYGDMDEDYISEIAVGRIIGRNIGDASAMVARSLYEQSREFTYEDDGDIAQNFFDSISDSWKENSFVVIGTTRTGPMPGCLKHAKAYQIATMQEGGFAPTALENFKANDMTVTEVVDKVQFAVYYGHGNPYTWYSNREQYITTDTLAQTDLKPGTAIAMACMTARTDNSTDTLSSLISLGFLNGGYNAYIGATRLAYGLFTLYDDDPATSVIGGPIEDTDALYLVDRFTNYISHEDLNVGMALMNARNDMVDRYNPDGNMGTRVAMYEYVLYGDPAYNMYVPSLD